MKNLLRKIGMDITFYTALAILYPTTKALELGARVYSLVQTRRRTHVKGAHNDE